jgi:hypothetical protein
MLEYFADAAFFASQIKLKLYRRDVTDGRPRPFL